MFAFRKQPLKFLYTLYFGTTTLFIRLPYWILISAIPSWRPRRSWNLTRALLVLGFKAGIDFMLATSGTPVPNPKVEEASAHKNGFVWVEPISSEYVRGEIADMAKTNGVSPARIFGYWLGKRALDGTHAQPAGPEERVLYHLHGGVYTMGSGSASSPSAHAPLGIIKSCSQIVDRAFCVDYRVSSAPPFESANPYPAALIDAVSGYQYLLHTAKFKPDNIIISGDSAGGHLAVTLSRYLAQLDDPYLPLPRALILLSPSTDWGCTHDGDPTSSMHRNANSDFVAPLFTSGYTARAILGCLPEDDIQTNPWLSPSSLELSSPKGLFTGTPPTCIISGGAEHTVDPMRTLRDRIVADTNTENVLYLEYEDAVHDFLIFTFHEPERSQALREIATWLANVM